MTHVISIINMKGGVGKTTTTVALAETLSACDKFRKRVLVIDLDPQTNATTMLIGEEKWRKLKDSGRTLTRLFKDALESHTKKFDFDMTLQKGVSDISEANTIDLLPASPDLIEVQYRLAFAPIGKFYAVNPTVHLWRAVQSRLANYDVVIVDCPPNLGIITLNGLRISQSYIIPTIPDILSTYGIPQIVTRVKKFSDEIEKPIKPLGILVNKFQANSSVHKNVLHSLQHSKDAPVFDTTIPQANDIAAAAEHVGYSRTFKQKYGYSGISNSYRALAKEILDKLEG